MFFVAVFAQARNRKPLLGAAQGRASIRPSSSATRPTPWLRLFLKKSPTRPSPQGAIRSIALSVFWLRREPSPTCASGRASEAGKLVEPAPATVNFIGPESQRRESSKGLGSPGRAADCPGKRLYEATLYESSVSGSNDSARVPIKRKPSESGRVGAASAGIKVGKGNPRVGTQQAGEHQGPEAADQTPRSDCWWCR